MGKKKCLHAHFSGIKQKYDGGNTGLCGCIVMIVNDSPLQTVLQISFSVGFRVGFLGLGFWVWFFFLF